MKEKTFQPQMAQIGTNDFLQRHDQRSSAQSVVQQKQPLQNLFEEGELAPDSVVRNFQTTGVELIVDRANPDEPNMALTTWSGSRVRKHDVIVAKNYLSEDEVDTLNRLVVIFLEQAELRAKQKQELRQKGGKA